MSVEKRTISFYAFSFKEYKKKKTIESWKTTIFDLILRYIESLPVEDRLLKDEKSKKSYYLSDIKYEDNIRCLIFKSCKFGHCPPIMDSDTALERPTDKKMNEGEQESTHLAIRMDSAEGFVVLESRKSGISIGKIVNYFNKMINSYFVKNPKDGDSSYSLNMFYTIVPIKNFNEALQNMSKLKIADIYVNRDSIGSELNNLMPEEDPFIKDEVILTLKTKRGENLLVRSVKQIYSNLSNSAKGVSRIRIHGTNTSGAAQVLDSEIIKRTEKIEAKLNDKGIISSDSIFNKMIEILRI